MVGSGCWKSLLQRAGKWSLKQLQLSWLSCEYNEVQPFVFSCGGEAGGIFDAGFEELLLKDESEKVGTVPVNTHPKHQK